MNSDCGVNKTEIDDGKGKEKLSNMEDGSENPSKPDTMVEKVEQKIGQLAINDLPGELLTKIIEMLPISQWASLESVNHSFQKVVHGLWGKLNEIRLDKLVYNEEKKQKKPCLILESVLKKFLRRAPNVTSISVLAEFFNGGLSIRLETIQILSKFQHLQTIDFSGRYMTAEIFLVFLELSSSRQCWKNLDIGFSIYGMIKSRSAVINKNQPALNLECFKFNMETFYIFDRFLPIEWSGLKKLIVVCGFSSAKEVLKIIRQCTRVTHLEFSAPQCVNGIGQTTYLDFMQGVADLANLSILKIVGYSQWDDTFHNALLMMIQRLASRQITDLALVGLGMCTDEIIGAIIDYLPRLKSLELEVDRCTKPALIRLSNEMRRLESLKFRSCKIMVDSTIISAIGNMNHLQCLLLDNRIFGLSKDFNSLGHLQKLKELRVTGRSVDSRTIEIWIGLGFGSCMETLELSLQYGISPEFLGVFLKNMPRLRAMKLTGVIDSLLYAISETCPKLIELDLWYSPTITSNGLQSVIDRCSQLKILNVYRHDEWFPSSLTVEKYRKITFKSEFGDDEWSVFGSVFP